VSEWNLSITPPLALLKEGEVLCPISHLKYSTHFKELRANLPSYEEGSREVFDRYFKKLTTRSNKFKRIEGPTSLLEEGLREVCGRKQKIQLPKSEEETLESVFPYNLKNAYFCIQ
jgi:hypothetical protein